MQFVPLMATSLLALLMLLMMVVAFSMWMGDMDHYSLMMLQLLPIVCGDDEYHFEYSYYLFCCWDIFAECTGKGCIYEICTY
jgi:hypothetical protein